MSAGGISRTSLVTGPSLNSWNGAKFFSKSDFNVKLDQQTQRIETSAHGKVDERVINVDAEVTITPEGRWNAAIVSALWPYAGSGLYADPVIGFSAGGASDVPLVMVSTAETHTLVSAVLTKMPSIFLSTTKTMVGAATWRGIRANNSVWSSSTSLYTIDTGGAPYSLGDTTFAPSLIKEQPFVGVWGGTTGFGAIQTQDGWTIDFNLSLEPLSVDAFGIIDYRYKELEVMAKCVPIGPTGQNVLDALKIEGSHAARGRSLNDDGTGSVSPNLVITGDDSVNYVTISAAALKTGGYRFGATVLRDDEIGFVATRTFSGGLQQPLFTLGH